MKKRIALIALLSALVLVLCACSATENGQDARKNQQGQAQSSPMDQAAQQNSPSVPDLPAGYDPSSEEDDGAFNA